MSIYLNCWYCLYCSECSEYSVSTSSNISRNHRLCYIVDQGTLFWKRHKLPSYSDYFAKDANILPNCSTSTPPDNTFLLIMNSHQTHKHYFQTRSVYCSHCGDSLDIWLYQYSLSAFYYHRLSFYWLLLYSLCPTVLICLFPPISFYLLTLFLVLLQIWIEYYLKYSQ